MSTERIATLEQRLAEYERRMGEAREEVRGLGTTYWKADRVLALLTPPAPSSPTPPPAPKAKEPHPLDPCICGHAYSLHLGPCQDCSCMRWEAAPEPTLRAEEGALEPKKSPHGKIISALASIVRLGEPDGATKATWQRTGRELIEREPVVQAVVTIRSAADALHAEVERLKKERDEHRCGDYCIEDVIRERDAAVTARRVAESEAAQLKLDARIKEEGMGALRALYGARADETWADFLQRTVTARQEAEEREKKLREALVTARRCIDRDCHHPSRLRDEGSCWSAIDAALAPAGGPEEVAVRFRLSRGSSWRKP